MECLKYDPLYIEYIRLDGKKVRYQSHISYKCSLTGSHLMNCMRCRPSAPVIAPSGGVSASEK